jgi:hypothetical protein
MPCFGAGVARLIKGGKGAGSQTRVMWTGESAILYCDGTSWIKVWGITVPMKASIYPTANQTFASGALTKITIGALSDDTGLMASIAGGDITTLRPNEYDVRAQIMYNSNNASSCLAECHVYDITQGSARLCHTGITCGAGSNASPMTGIRVTLAAGDHIELWGCYYGGSFATTTRLFAAGWMTFLQLSEVPSW